MATKTFLQRLTPSLQKNQQARSMAKKLDSQSTSLDKWRSKAKETENRPGRAKRAACTQLGVAVTGLATGLVENGAARGAIAGTLGAIGMGIGIALNSDAAFDVGNGAAAVTNYLTTSKVSNTLKNLVMNAMSGDDVDPDADVIDAEEPETAVAP